MKKLRFAILLLLAALALSALADSRRLLLVCAPRASAVASDVTSNLVWWLDAASISATNTATAATWAMANIWSNQAPGITTSNFSYQSGDSPQSPVYNTNVQNGLPGVHFGSQAGLEDAMVLNSGAFTLFVVAKLDNTSSTGRRAINGLNNWLIGPYSGHWQVYDGGFIADSAALDTSAHAFAVTSTSGGAVKFYKGGTNNLIGNNTMSTWPGNMVIASAPGSEYLLGWLLEMRMYPRLLSDDELNTVFTRLTAKWGL